MTVVTVAVTVTVIVTGPRRPELVVAVLTPRPPNGQELGKKRMNRTKRQRKTKQKKRTVSVRPLVSVTT